MTAALLSFAAVLLYGAPHSLLASWWAKRKARQSFGALGARGYRLFYNIVAVITFIPVLAVPAWMPGPTLYSIPWPWLLLTGALQLLAAGAIAIGVLQTDAAHFLGLRQLMVAEERPSELIVSGLYRWVRHPLYSAGLLFIWLTPVMTTGLLGLNLGLTVYVYLGSLFEERRLIDEFGAAYRSYQARVPRLIPLPWRSGTTLETSGD